MTLRNKPNTTPSVKADRRERVWQLRLAGNSYRQIADRRGRLAHDCPDRHPHRTRGTGEPDAALGGRARDGGVCAARQAHADRDGRVGAEKAPAMLNAIIRAIYTRARLRGIIKPSTVTVNANVTIVEQLQMLLPQLIALVPPDRLASAEGLISTIERALPAPEKEATCT